MLTLQILAIAFCLALIGFIIVTIRRSWLNARYALVWLAASVLLLVLSLFRPMLDSIALAVGVTYPPSLLFLIAFIFLLLIVLHYSLVISSHRDSIRRLGQAVARLERELHALTMQEGTSTSSNSSQASENRQESERKRPAGGAM